MADMRFLALVLAILHIGDEPVVNSVGLAPVADSEADNSDEHHTALDKAGKILCDQLGTSLEWTCGMPKTS